MEHLIDTPNASRSGRKDDPTAYDYIVVGAGSAGCVVAARLSEDPTCSVLLIEAGGTDRTPLCMKPGMISIVHTVPEIKKTVDWGYYTTPREETLNRKIPTVRGKVMGGSSSINGLLFVRGNRANFDSWAAQGCEGWSWDDVLPAFRKLETFEDGSSTTRGGSGPVQVTRTKFSNPVSGMFADAVRETTGVDWIDDYNTGEQEGVFVVQQSARDGLRYSTSQAYIVPAAERRNLDVLTGVTVRRVLLEGTRCVGVEVEGPDGIRSIGATSEVVLSAGVIGSPHILQLSGIGPAAHLRSIGVQPIIDLPVGMNLHDHLFFPLVFLAPEAKHRGTAPYFFAGIAREYVFGDHWFGRTVFETMAFVKTDPSEPIPNLQIHTLPWAYPAPNQDAPVRPTVDTRPCITVQPTLIYPKSRGEVLAKSADPHEKPHIDPHYLEHPDDMEFLLDSIELCREMARAPAIAQALDGELEPGPAFFDRVAMRKELPNRICTVYHPVGTCRMGVDERAVVDPQLRVRGIEGLRVADASIMPSITGGNTNAPAIMIGERCVELMRG